MKKLKIFAILLTKFTTRYSRRTWNLFKAALSQRKHSNIKLGTSARRYNSPKFKILNFLYHYRYQIVVLAIIVFCINLVVFTARHNSQAVVSEGMAGLYTFDTLPPAVTNLISQPLFSFDKSGMPRPLLAESFFMDDRATTFTVKLKENLVWNDGTSVNSSDIKFNLSDVEISYPDNRTIQFKLVDSYSPFLNLLTNPIFKSQTLTGIGRYKLSHYDLTKGYISRLVLTPNKLDASYSQDLPLINIRFYESEATTKTAFELGEIEAIVGLQDDSTYRNISTIGSKKYPNFSKVVSLFYNTKDSYLSDKNFRKALSYSISNFDNEEKAKTPIPPFSWAFNSSVKENTNNQDLARSYLEKVDQGKDRELVLTTTPSLAKVGERVIQSWQNLGLRATLKIENGLAQNFQILLMAHPIPTDPDQYALWHSTQIKTNITKFASARIDKDLEDGRRETNPDTRKERYMDFQKVLIEEAPATFLYFPKTNIVYRKKTGANVERVLNLQFGY